MATETETIEEDLPKKLALTLTLPPLREFEILVLNEYLDENLAVEITDLFAKIERAAAERFEINPEEKGWQKSDRGKQISEFVRNFFINVISESELSIQVPE
jgi:hypothetical protein